MVLYRVLRVLQIFFSSQKEVLRNYYHNHSVWASMWVWHHERDRPPVPRVLLHCIEICGQHHLLWVSDKYTLLVFLWPFRLRFVTFSSSDFVLRVFHSPSWRSVDLVAQEYYSHIYRETTVWRGVRSWWEVFFWAYYRGNVRVIVSQCGTVFSRVKTPPWIRMMCSMTESQIHILLSFLPRPVSTR